MSRKLTSKPQQIDGLRDSIRALQAEQSALLAQPRSRAEVIATVEPLLDHMHTAGAEATRRELLRLAAGGPAEFLRVKGSAVVAGVPGAAAVTLDLAPLLVTLLGRDVIRAAMLAHIEAIPEGHDRTARRLRLAEIDNELDTIEIEEERLIEASEGTDAPIARRPDARPEIVLAP